MFKKVSDSVVRAARTLVQTFVGGVIAANVLSGVSVTSLTSVGEWEKVGIAAAFAGFSAVVSYVHNVLEAKNVIPSTKGA